jgi:hypothetical protein
VSRDCMREIEKEKEGELKNNSMRKRVTHVERERERVKENK